MKVKRSIDWNPGASPTFWINHASRLIMRGFEQGLRPLGFGFAYLPVVMALSKAECPLQQKDLAAQSSVEQPTMAALLGRMERDGLVQRERHPDDQRASLISLTAKAKTRLPEARKQLELTVDRALEGLTQRERKQLIGLLERIVQNLSVMSDAQ